MGQTRNRINTVVNDRLYQRGQILSWKRADKLALFEELNIGIVVNFWPKLDPDMSDMPCWYWYLPSGSDDMVSTRVSKMARLLASLLTHGDYSALILCEAGKTRSVFFAGLVVHYMQNIAGTKVLRVLDNTIPGNRMKPYMLEYFRNLT
jgi:hypothetical protein